MVHNKNIIIRIEFLEIDRITVMVRDKIELDNFVA